MPRRTSITLLGGLAIAVLTLLAWLGRDPGRSAARLESPDDDGRSEVGAALSAPPSVGDAGTSTSDAARARESVTVALPRTDESAPRPKVLRLELVDRVVLQPVPYLEVTLSQDGETRWAGRTDVQGCVDAEARWSADPISIEVATKLDVEAGPVRTSGETRQRVLVAIGPTYLLAGNVCDEPRDLESVIRTPAGEFWYVKHELECEPVPLVRFEWIDEGDFVPAPWTLQVFEERGALHGEAALDRVLGFEPEPVTIDLVERGCAWVTYRDDAGRELDGASVEVHAADGSVIHARQHPSGNSWVRGIPFGPARIVASAPGFADEVLMHDVSAGRDDLDVTFREPLAPGAVSGRVSIPGAPIPAGLRVRLDDARHGDRTAAVDATGAFRFDGVPAGHCRLDGVVDAAEPARHAFGAVDLIAPAEGVVLELELVDGPLPTSRTPGTCEFRIEIVDARTGAPVIEAVDAWVRTVHLDGALWHKPDIAWGGAAGDAIRWGARAHDYRPTFGDQTAFAPAPPTWLGPTEGRVAVARLEPGWGARVRVVDAHLLPVPAVVVLVDAQPAGATDARGHLVLALDERPRRIGVGGGWKLAPGGMVDPETGAFGDPFPELVVAVAPR